MIKRRSSWLIPIKVIRRSFGIFVMGIAGPLCGSFSYHLFTLNLWLVRILLIPSAWLPSHKFVSPTRFCIFICTLQGYRTAVIGSDSSSKVCHDSRHTRTHIRIPKSRRPHVDIKDGELIPLSRPLSGSLNFGSIPSKEKQREKALHKLGY